MSMKNVQSQSLVSVSEVQTFRDPFKTYKENVINHLCESFLPIYKEISEPLWNNGVFAYVKRAYFYYDRESGDFEFWISSAPNGENYMCSFRVAGRVVPKLSPKRLVDESRRLRTRFVSPMSLQDGEAIFVVSPRAVKDEKGNLPRAFCHNSHKGYMTYPIIQKRPERAVELILTLVWNYVYKRLKGYCEKLNIQKWVMDKLLRGSFKVGRNILSYLSAHRYSLTFINILENFVALCRWLWIRIKKMRVLMKIQVSMTILRDRLLWIKHHIKEGEFLKEINKFLKSVERKLQTYKDSTNLKSESKFKECSFIPKYKRDSFILLRNPDEYDFKDDPEELRKREKALLELLKT